MTDRNITAYTHPHGPNPAYVNVSWASEDGSSVVISIRGADGVYSVIEVPGHEYRRMLDESIRRMTF